LPEAIRKMTSLAADNVGIANRGRIVPGAFADLLLFDPATVIDNATPADPHAVSTGLAKVWVNGKLAYEGGKTTGVRGGMVIRRKGGDSAASARAAAGTLPAARASAAAR